MKNLVFILFILFATVMICIGCSKEHSTNPVKNSFKIKCECGYNVRATRKWATMGVPVCYCGKIMELEEDLT